MQGDEEARDLTKKGSNIDDTEENCGIEHMIQETRFNISWEMFLL